MSRLLAVLVTFSIPGIGYCQTDLAATGSTLPAFKTVARGSVGSASISVRNQGSATATNVRLNISLPPSTTFNGFNLRNVPCSAPPEGSAGPISCTYSSLAPGSGNGVTLYYDIPLTYPIDSNATVIGSVTSDTPDSDPSNNSTTVSTSVRGRADLVGTLTAGAERVKPTEKVSWIFTASNRGPDPARNARIGASVYEGTNVSMTPSTGTCSFGSASAQCNVGDMAPGEIRTLTVVANAPSFESSAFSASAGALTFDDVDPTPNDSGQTVWVPVSLPGVADMSVTMVPASAVHVNTDVPIQFTFRNDGPDTSTQPSLQIMLPTGITFRSFQQTAGPRFSCGRVSPGESLVACDLFDPFPAATTVAFVLTLHVDATGFGGTIRAIIIAITEDPDAQNNSVTLRLGSPPRRHAVHR
ncbi:MAG TPA: hypothetical protein VLV78_02715 [Thermoanaerobaculia bacterium]|nr:hypothetical protein [Thermoanaerobaculia bacterium]